MRLRAFTATKHSIRSSLDDSRYCEPKSNQRFFRRRHSHQRKHGGKRDLALLEALHALSFTLDAGLVGDDRGWEISVDGTNLHKK